LFIGLATGEKSEIGAEGDEFKFESEVPPLLLDPLLNPKFPSKSLVDRP
jgi:hypothetical protein